MALRGAAISGPGGIQLGPPHIETHVNRTGAALTKGEIVMLDVTQSATESTSNTPGAGGYEGGSGVGASSGLTNVVDPATASLNFGFFGVVTKGGADDDIVEVGWSGELEVTFGAAVAAGATFGPTNASNAPTTPVATGLKVCGIVLDSLAAAGTTRCIWDGLTGLGTGA